MPVEVYERPRPAVVDLRQSPGTSPSRRRLHLPRRRPPPPWRTSTERPGRQHARAGRRTGSGKTTPLAVARLYDPSAGSVASTASTCATCELADLPRSWALSRRYLPAAHHRSGEPALPKPAPPTPRSRRPRGRLNPDLSPTARGTTPGRIARAPLLRGEKRASAIAGPLRDPRVLVLTQSTSALDTLSRTGPAKAFDPWPGRTTITIAHRLSTVLDSDQIVYRATAVSSSPGDHSTCWPATAVTPSWPPPSGGRARGAGGQFAGDAGPVPPGRRGHAGNPASSRRLRPIYSAGPPP